MMTLRGFVTLAASIAAFVPAYGQDYPARQIEVVVPFPPGGTSDLSVRFLADKWKEFLGQPVIIINKPGAGSAVGAKFVANSKPDGYTLLIASETSLLSVPNMQPEAGYTKDSFTYLFAYSKGAVVFASRADAPWKTLPELVAAAKANPQLLTYSSYGTGTMGHFTAELLWKELGVSVRHIPYKSSPEANSAMLGGHTNLSVPSIIGSIEQNPDVKILAISAEARTPYAPQIPTLIELGYKTNLSYMNIVVGPKGMPTDVVQKLNEAHAKAYEKYKPEIDAGMAKLELSSILLPGAEVAAVIAQRDAWYRDLAPQLNARD
jgi:tripartite-type tricarboxylate transporter receptor subunit TctC